MIVQVVENHVGLHPNFKILPYGVRSSVHVALNYLSNSSAYRCTGALFGVPTSAAHYMTSTVIDALVAAAPQWIKWPSSQEQARIANDFFKFCKIPGK